MLGLSKCSCKFTNICKIFTTELKFTSGGGWERPSASLRDNQVSIYYIGLLAAPLWLASVACSMQSLAPHLSFIPPKSYRTRLTVFKSTRNQYSDAVPFRTNGRIARRIWFGLVRLTHKFFKKYETKSATSSPAGDFSADGTALASLLGASRFVIELAVQ